MRILLFGKNGQLGWESRRALATLGEVAALDYPEINFTDVDSLRQVVRKLRPQVIVNAAAYTAVDRAEDEPELTWAINAVAPGILAEEARLLGAALIHYSTDYVFDGSQQQPYRETDIPNPINVYGKSKLAGEQAVQDAGGTCLIFRTSWVYSLRQGGFVTKVLEWARKQRTMRVVIDQVASPTWCRMLAEATAQVLATGREEFVPWLSDRKGLYHLAGSGSASRLEWARAILQHDPHREEQVVEEILPALTSEFPDPAVRPPYSALNCDRFTATFGLRLPEWERALELAMELE